MQWKIPRIFYGCPPGMEFGKIPGMVSFFKDLALALKNEGLKVGVIFPEVRQLRKLSLDSLKSSYFQYSSKAEDELPTLRMHGWNLFPKMMKLQMKAWCYFAQRLADRYVEQHGKPDIVHAQSCVWGGIAAREIAEKYSIPYCITEHRDTFVIKKVLGKDPAHCWSTPHIRHAFDKAASLISVSGVLRRSLVHYTQKNENEILHIPNPVDIEFFTPRKTSGRNNDFRFLTVARLIPRKNIAMLIRAFKKAFKGVPAVFLEIGGDGAEKENLVRLATELNIESQVRFLGELTRSQVSAAFQRASVFVLSSDNESFGVVCIEAMASGVPVISTRCGGSEDIITPEVGLFTEVGNEDAMAEALKKIYGSYQKYDPEIIRNLAIQKYSVQSVVKQHLEVYKKFIEY